MTKDKCKTAFVFTGGGSLGAVHVGMLRALMAAGERRDFVIGASVGAINAAHFAGAPTPEGVATLERVWCEGTAHRCVSDQFSERTRFASAP